MGSASGPDDSSYQEPTPPLIPNRTRREAVRC